MSVANHPNSKTLTENQRHWLAHIEAATNQGVTLKQYAEKHELPLQKLYGWKAALRKRGLLAQQQEAVSFAPVRVMNTQASCALRIQLPNGVAIEVLSPVAEPVLLAVLRVAGQLP